MSYALQRACTWCGPAFTLLFFAGMVLAGLLPPPSPNETAADVAAFYGDGTDRIRMGLVLIGAAAFVSGPWVVVISVQMRRIEGDRPLMTWLQLGAGAVGILVVILPTLLFGVAAFRPERDAQVTQAFHDVGFLALVGVAWPAMLQCVAIGIATLADAREQPIFPRWLGYLNLWVAFSFLGGPFILFFKSGPFSWAGALTFWVPAVIFGVWFWLMWWGLRRAIADEAAQAAIAPADAVVPDAFEEAQYA